MPRELIPLERALGVRFHDPQLGEASLTHRSFAFEQGALITNERLEFLGDAVLGLVVTDLAFRALPDRSEGELVPNPAQSGAAEHGVDHQQYRAAVDPAQRLAPLHDPAPDPGLQQVFKFSHEERDVAAPVAQRGEGERDYKTMLQELSAQDLGRLPEYRVRERGPDHEKEVTATVYLAGREFGRGTGRSKKEAEQRAAREAHARLTEGGEDLTGRRAEMAKEG